MKAIHAILFVLLATGVSGGSVEILSETSCPVEMTWSLIRIEGCKLLESDGMRILLSRGFPFDTESWTVDIDSEGNLLSCEETVPGQRLILSTSQLEDSSEMWLVACTAQNDTVWTCVLEGTDDFNNYQFVTELSDGGYLINSPPDCHTTYTDIHRISSTGEMIWHRSFETDYLLDLDEPVGETCPSIASIGETSSIDILIGGSVAQWYTSPDAWFVCLLDGDTGNLLWKTTGYALGEARILNAIETGDGSIIAVGETGECVVPEGMYYSVWGPRQPLVVTLDVDGALISMEILDPDRVCSFQALIEYDSGHDYMYDSVLPPLEFIIAGADTMSGEMVLLRAELSTE